jgi:uncharacterized protein YaiI (UPF0178 family)
MKIWIDADASPNPVKEIVYRIAERLQIEVILVANHALRTPPSKFIRAVQVAGGFDVADDYIVQQSAAGDVVVTQDIPLAAELMEKDVHVLTPRGETYTKDSVRQKLVMRDFMEEMRSGGMLEGGGPPPFGTKEKQAFANALDRLLAKRSS